MGAYALTVPNVDERRSRRAPFHGEFEYRYDGDRSGKAKWCSVGREGACIRIGRYLSPGKRMTLDCQGLELDARVIWCRATAGGDQFVAGLQIVNGGAEASMLALSAIVQGLIA